ncbi:MAG: hypothetical protein QM723_05320 [Myxococcaceae bacterium]
MKEPFKVGEKIRFARDLVGPLDHSAAVKFSAAASKPGLPDTQLAAQTQIEGLASKRATAKGISFDEAMKELSKEQPELFAEAYPEHTEAPAGVAAMSAFAQYRTMLDRYQSEGLSADKALAKLKQLRPDVVRRANEVSNVTRLRK